VDFLLVQGLGFYYRFRVHQSLRNPSSVSLSWGLNWGSLVEGMGGCEIEVNWGLGFSSPGGSRMFNLWD
jgi:hypothetical protein